MITNALSFLFIIPDQISEAEKDEDHGIGFKGKLIF